MSEIIKQPIEEEVKSAYLDYAMSVIVGRAIPDLTVIHLFTTHLSEWLRILHLDTLSFRGREISVQ